MRISKKNLLSLIKENIEEMAMTYDDQSRPHPDITGKLERGETPYKKVPLPKTGQEPQQNFQELLASERYKQVIQRIRQYTGVNRPIRTIQDIGPLTMMMMDAHNSIVTTENAHRTELEKLAVKLVMKEMGVEEGQIEYDAKIVGMGEIDTSDFNMEQSSGPEIPEVSIEVEEELFTDLEKLNMEMAKRRLINSMIQGASKKGHYMYHYVADEIRNITGSDTLINNYGILMSINDTLYWQMSDEQMKMAMGAGGESGLVGGKESVDTQSDPPKVIARGINFPVLVHELIKGTMEVIAIHGRPEEEGAWENVEKSEDTLEKEMWDLRLGPSIWDRFRSQFPDEILTNEDQIKIQNFLLMRVFKLPAKEFLVFCKEVISKSDTGKRLVQNIVDSIHADLQERDYEDAMESFDDTLDEISDNTSDDDLKDFLGGLGIDLSNEPEE
jgi:hypothetical protein